jgi:hypothetical protein
VPKGPRERDDVTAYVLGELGNDETTQLEVELKNDSGLRTEFEELRELSELISRELRVGERLGLTLEQRRKILAASTPKPRPLPTPSPRTVLVPVPVASPGMDALERFEFLLVFLGLTSLDLVLPRAPAFVHGVRLQLRRWARGNPDYEFSEEPGRFGIPEQLTPAYMKLALFAALAAVLAYAWLRIKRHPKSPMPFSAFVIVLFLHLVFLLALLRFLA